MIKRKNFVLFHILLASLGLAGCSNVTLPETPAAPAPIVVEGGKVLEEQYKPDADTAVQDAGKSPENPNTGEADAENSPEDRSSQRIPVKVKGIYVSAYVAGTQELIDNLIREIDRTEANALVIDLKDDYGRVVCEMNSLLVQEIGSVKTYIPDMEGLMRKLDEHDIYTIARIPLFRDAWLGEVRPDWCVKRADGSVFEDRDGNTWVNPYKQEAWDYLIEIAIQAGELGFDEVQFDYVRFCTERGMNEVIFEEADVQGRSKTDIICEFMEYAYDILRKKGLFVSADVFGAIINSGVDADSVGQIYGEMAKHLDYISPMIYPSHYADGNFGIDHPDLHPYETIYAAMMDSRKELYFAGQEAEHIAQVRPWLQDFTATWLKNHIEYGPEQIREQIQATYSAGYDEWLLWDAACRYTWNGLLNPEQADAEAKAIAQSRAAEPELTWEKKPETAVGVEEAPETAVGVQEAPETIEGTESQGNTSSNVMKGAE